MLKAFFILFSFLFSSYSQSCELSTKLDGKESFDFHGKKVSFRYPSKWGKFRKIPFMDPNVHKITVRFNITPREIYSFTLGAIITKKSMRGKMKARQVVVYKGHDLGSEKVDIWQHKSWKTKSGINYKFNGKESRVEAYLPKGILKTSCAKEAVDVVGNIIKSLKIQ